MTKRNIVHIEIPSRNHEESGKFYRELFGWKITAMPEMNYLLWEPAEGPGGGFNPLGEMVKAGEILIYVNSDNIETDLEKARSLGAKIISPKQEITGVGWFGIFEDLTGNKIALYTSMDPKYNK